jgi:predicted RNA-binding protein with PIN domain
MPYVIDGNNVMAQQVGWHTDKAGARKRLIHQLARFLAVRKVKIRVVFDGTPDDEFPDGGRYKSVHVLYARPGSDADTRIQSLIRKSTNKRDLILVTSDKALAAFARGQGTKIVSSGQFRKMMAEALAAGPEKPVSDQPVNVEDWLEYFKGSEH